MNLSVFTVLMPENTLDEICAITANAGCKGLELRVKDLTEAEKKGPYGFWANHKADIGVKNLRGQTGDIRKTADKYKLEIPAVASYCFSYEHEDIEEVVKCLPMLGCKMFRIRPPLYDRAKDDYNKLYEQTVKDFERIEKLCKANKVKACIETHMNTIVPSASLTMRVAEKFDPGYIGVIVDPGNMVFEGFENYMMGLQLIGKHLSHVHVKNMKWVVKETRADGSIAWKCDSCSAKEGVADLRQLTEDLKKTGYTGWYTFEDFSSGDPKAKIDDWVSYMKTLNV